MRPRKPFENCLILTGPTASGKTALALELADHLDAEIIAMDSMTLYRGMDIGTAKPTLAERAQVPHYLLDVLDPWESANVAWWMDRAAEHVRDIEARGKQALFVGGTPFYLKALLCGLFDSPPADQDLRRELEAEAEREGPQLLHERLAKIDPITASRLHLNDVRRVVRALEVWLLTGKPLSEWQQQQWRETRASAEDPLEKPRCVVIDLDREELDRRINARVRVMIDRGWIEEVKRIRELPHALSREASQALGYSELSAVLEGRWTLEQAIAEIQLRSRQFAKRQRTWFRSIPGCQLLEGKLTFTLWRRTMI